MTFLLKFVADYFRLIIGILALSASCHCEKDFNLTFYNESKTWSEAKDFCFVNGGILEADETIIRNYHDYTKDNVKLWLGAYSMITPWTGVLGCYLWNADDRKKSIEFELQNKEECQIRCPHSKYEFFVFKEKTCYCLEGDKLPHDDISRNKCSNYTETDYVFIYKQNIVPDIDTDSTDTHNCVVVECKNLDRILNAENCDSMYPVICENPKKRSTMNAYNATNFCEEEGSFVSWDPSLSCKNSEESFDSKHWTSITRSTQFIRLIATGSRPLINNASNESPEHNATMEQPDSGHITRYITQGMIVGIVGSVIIIILITVVIMVFMFRRVHSRKLLSLSTIVKNEPSTSRMDSNTVNAAYEQLNKTDTDNITHCQSYDQLIVHEADKPIRHNTRISREDESKYESIEEPIEKYNNALTTEYEQLEQSKIAKTTNVYDPLYYTSVEDFDRTNARSNSIVLREEYRKYDTSQTENETDTNVVSLEYEQLDITKTDTSTKVYDQLHDTHTAGNESTNNRPKLIVSGEERTNNESSKDKKEVDSRIVSSEYEQLDITEQDKRTNTYDQLDFKHSAVNEYEEPTDEHSNNILPKEIDGKCKPMDHTTHMDTNIN